jgi:hypothetical protein
MENKNPLQYSQGHTTNPSNSISLRSILILSSYLLFCLPSFPLPPGFPTKCFAHHSPNLATLMIFGACSVAAVSERWAMSARALNRGFETCLGYGSLSLVFLCCVVLCRQRPCDELITGPRIPNVCRKIG